jgi:hypothetical protein
MKNQQQDDEDEDDDWDNWEEINDDGVEIKSIVVEARCHRWDECNCAAWKTCHMPCKNRMCHKHAYERARDYFCENCVVKVSEEIRTFIGKKVIREKWIKKKKA